MTRTSSLDGPPGLDGAVQVTRVTGTGAVG
jgi:hypothetical protein